MIVRVAVAAPIAKPLSYKTQTPIDAGAFVVVPLGGRDVVGIVLGAGAESIKLKAVKQVLPFVPVSPQTLAFLERAARYTMAPIGMLVRLMASVPTLADPYDPPQVIIRGKTTPQRMTPAREKVLTAVEQPFDTITALAQAAEVSTGVVTGLLKDGALQRVAQQPSQLDINTAAVTLSAGQTEAAHTVCALARDSKTILLQGVTGSGKTEVYLEAVIQCLQDNPAAQVLIMVPEIALSAAFAERLQARFGDSVKQWHSGLSAGQRRATWQGVNNGDIRLIVGARSALFLPFRHLGLIVVDEEHDAGFKQDDIVLYNARDMAVLYGAMHTIPVILASATPSLETWVNAQSQRYAHVMLPERFGTAVMPSIKAIDLRETKLESGRWISTPLLDAITQTLASGEQALLFLNRRGYAPLTLCRTCGHRLECRQCSAWLVEHRGINRMVCHQCGCQSAIPKDCPDCHKDTLAACGPGIERLEEEVRALLPEARVAVLSSDLFASTQALQERITQIAQGDYDIIIGTQLVAKGYTFPKLTLVGVVDADLGLQGTDMRASERTFQVLQQVAGRAGRVGKQGTALLQTICPDHPVMQALLSGDTQAFWDTESQQRQHARVAPFYRMAGVIVSGKFSDQVWATARALAQSPIAPYVDMFGPAQAPIGLLRGKHRVRLLLKAPRKADLQTAIQNWLAQVKIASAIRVVIDIDPQSFM